MPPLIALSSLLLCSAHAQHYDSEGEAYGSEREDKFNASETDYMKAHDKWVAQVEKPVACSQECAHDHCTDHTIRYGNHCGATHIGCDGAAACDEYDKCCQFQNECVAASANGPADELCHHELITCLNNALAQGEPTWIDTAMRGVSGHDPHLIEASTTCTAARVVASMAEATDIALVFSKPDAPTRAEDGSRRTESRTQQAEDDEAKWRKEVMSGVRPYSAEQDAAFHNAKRQRVGPQAGPAKVMALDDGEHAYFQPRSDGGFKLAFKPRGANSENKYSAEEDALRHQQQLRTAVDRRYNDAYNAYKPEL